MSRHEQAYPDTSPAVRVTVLSSGGATVARTAYLDGATTVVTAGEAKREPGDDYDAETGRLLATARALEVLAGRAHRQQVKARNKLRELAGATGKAGKR